MHLENKSRLNMHLNLVSTVLQNNHIGIIFIFIVLHNLSIYQLSFKLWLAGNIYTYNW